MPTNFIVTGPPRSGKTTVVETLVDRLRDRDYRAGGIFSPERREGGERVGFEIVDVASGETRVLAHVDRQSGPSVGNYRVNVPNVDAISKRAFSGTTEAVDFVVVDEIAPMEVTSERFVEGVRRVLDADIPLVAAIHYRSNAGFIGAVKARSDVEVFDVTEETRDGLPELLVGRVEETL